MSRRRLAAGAVLLAAFAVVLTSCSFYGQAAVGQAEILLKRRSIDSLIDDAATPADLRERLVRVRDLREFAVRELALPDNRSYRTYVGLDRPYVVWNVYAAPEFSTAPTTWCYPIAGCAAYRGYFREARAKRYAARLQEKGYDVDLGGVRAYSTLGWFADPVLSTFLSDSETRLAGLLFHELAHQVAWAPGDTTFNESFATAVEIEGLRRWLADRDDGDELLRRHVLSGEREEAFLDLVLAARERLSDLYAQDLADEEMRRRKVEEIERLRDEYETLKTSWDGDARYDGFFAQDLNNAHFAVLGAYHGLVPAFQELLAASGGDLPAFYEAVRKLADLPAEEREQRLQERSTRGKLSATESSKRTMPK